MHNFMMSVTGGVPIGVPGEHVLKRAQCLLHLRAIWRSSKPTLRLLVLLL